MKKTGDINYIIFCVMTVTVLLLNGCAEEDAKVEATYSSLWDNVFSSCGVSCHSANATNGTEEGPLFTSKSTFYTQMYGQSASDYAGWVGSGQYTSGCDSFPFIDVGNPNNSTLAASLILSVSEGVISSSCQTAYSVHAATGDVISGEAADALIAWIKAGAKND